MMHNPCTPDCFAAGKDAGDYATFRLHVIFKIGTLCCLDYQVRSLSLSLSLALSLSLSL